MNLPAQITLRNGEKFNVRNWTENGNMDGFIGEVVGLPMKNYKSSEEIEDDIWENNLVKADIYLDGTGTVSIKL